MVGVSRCEEKAALTSPAGALPLICYIVECKLSLSRIVSTAVIVCAEELSIQGEGHIGSDCRMVRISSGSCRSWFSYALPPFIPKPGQQSKQKYPKQNAKTVQQHISHFSTSSGDKKLVYLI